MTDEELTMHVRKEEALNNISHALLQADILVRFELHDNDTKVHVYKAPIGICKTIEVTGDIEDMIFTVMIELIKDKITK